jgi:flavin-dependent dehydrogenase
VTTVADRYDVAILGGGLAGLTLALQLKRARSDVSIVVAEKRKGPAPLAAFKVGESTVEVSAHYFAEVCGLREHLENDQIVKAGLRFFLPAGDNRDIARRVEWGSPAVPPFHSYQVDRGLFENELAERCLAHGVDIWDGSFVDDVELGDDAHTVTVVRGGVGGERTTVAARWVVDATGRAFLLKRKLDLMQDIEHTINSSWLRLSGGLVIDNWSDDPAWQERMLQPRIRHQSTNHLMGKGYWVWLIPLSTGSISIGICADPRFHPFERISTLDAAIDWLNEHEPQVGEAVSSRRDDVEDFLKVEDFAYGCKRVYSPQRWALTGEAGPFADPFYSPGSDYIALGNGCIADLVLRDLAGKPIEERVEQFNAMFLESFDWVMTFYTRQYEVWGNPQVMSAKLAWDFIVYWGLKAIRFVHGVWHDPEFMAEVRETLLRGHRLNARVQGFFREWHAIDDREAEGRHVSPVAFPGLVARHLDLESPMDREAVKRRMAENVEFMEAVAVAFFHKAATRLPDGDSVEDRAINPYAISLDPSRWEADGLFEGAVLTLDEALAKTEGIESLWLDKLAVTASV